MFTNQFPPNAPESCDTIDEDAVVIAEPSDEEADVTIAFVLAFTSVVIPESAEPSDEDAVAMRSAVLAVPAVTAEPSDEEAVCTSVRVAREPESRPAPVMVRVMYPQTLPGSDVSEAMICDTIDEEADVIAEPSDEDAEATIALVFAFTSVVMPESAVPSDEDAVVIVPAVLAVPVVIAEPRDEEAVCTSESVAREPVSSPAPVIVRVTYPHTSPGIEVTDATICDTIDEEADVTIAFVFAFTSDTIELDAVVMRPAVLAVPAVTAEPSDEEAVCTSESVARDPESRPDPVRVRVM
jgi:hypothetical protein